MVCESCLTSEEVSAIDEEMMRMAAGSAPAEARDHRLSAERIMAATDVLRGFAAAYLPVVADDVSPEERRRLAGADELLQMALDEFDLNGGTPFGALSPPGRVPWSKGESGYRAKVRAIDQRKVDRRAKRRPGHRRGRIRPHMWRRRRRPTRPGISPAARRCRCR